jgi:hypothetical protein
MVGIASTAGTARYSLLPYTEVNRSGFGAVDTQLCMKDR